MTIAVYPGSFDPITLGHVDVVRRATGVFDEVIVAVGVNASKNYLFAPDERLDLTRRAVEGMRAVSVEPMEGLLVDFCRSRKATAIVKGLRSNSDFDAERPMALMNRSIGEIETVFMLGDSALAHVASSLVKDVARHGGETTGLVPDHVRSALDLKFSASERPHTPRRSDDLV